MTMRAFLLVALVAGACSNSTPSDPADAASTPADGGMPMADTGVGADAGPPPPDAGPAVDAGPPAAMVDCDMLPATLSSGRTDDVYYSAVQVCGVPGASCVVRAEAEDACAGADVLVGLNVVDAGEVRVRSGWTVVSASAGEPLDQGGQRSIPIGEEANVILQDSSGARFALTFTVDFGSVHVASFAPTP